MKNLFVVPLESLTISDVYEFTGLGGASGDGIGEGLRVDYKVKDVEDIGLAVAAMANSFGGLVLLGCAEENGKPTAIRGIGKKGATDTKTRIANLIESTVSPKPRFDVAVVQTEANAEVAIVRVEEGGFPPYMFTKTHQNKIPVRSADRSRNATLSEIEQLFARRQIDSQQDWVARRGSVTNRLGVPTRHAPEGERSHYHRIWIHPWRVQRLFLDHQLESTLEAMLRRQAPGDKRVTGRSAAHVEFGSPEKRLHVGYRRWRVESSGSVGFISQLLDAGASATGLLAKASLVDIALNAVQALRMGADVLRHQGWSGRVLVESDLCPMGAPIELTSPDVGQRLNGSGGLAHAEDQPDIDHWEVPLDFAQLEDAVIPVTWMLVAHLRTLRRAEVDAEVFAKSLRAICDAVHGTRSS